MSKIVCDASATEVTKDNVSKMVRTFYKMIMGNQTVNPYFIMTLGKNLESKEWEEHYNILENFWLLLMNGEKGYTGDAFEPHVDLPEMHKETFEVWLKLFHEVVHLYYSPKLAQKFYKRAEVMSNQFMTWLNIE